MAAYAWIENRRHSNESWIPPPEVTAPAATRETTRVHAVLLIWKVRDPFYQGFHGCHGEHSMPAVLPHKQEIQQQVTITSWGKKEGSSTQPEKPVHGLCEPLMGSKHFSINSSLLSVSQAGQNDEEENHGLFKMCTVPITRFTMQGMVSLVVWNYNNMMLPPNKLCSKGPSVEHFSPGIFQKFHFCFLVSSLIDMCKDTSNQTAQWKSTYGTCFLPSFRQNLLRIEWWLLKEPLLSSMDP